jgi:hypothetical protein
MSVLSSLLCALAVASPLIGASNQSLPLSAWVDGCATRTHAIGGVHVTGFHLRAVLTEAQIAPLVEFEAIDSLSRETASSLIGTFTAAAPYREAFRYELWSSDGLVVVRRARDAELDTFVAWLESERDVRFAADTEAVLPPMLETTFFAADGSATIVQNQRVVLREPLGGRDGVLARFDPTRPDWTPLLDDSMHPEGQTRAFEVDDTDSERARLVYRRTAPTPATTSYDVWPGDMFRPESVRSVVDGELRMSVRFLFEEGAPEVPVAVLSRSLNRGQGTWTVDLFVFTDGSFGPAVELPDGRLPALHREIRPLEGTTDFIMTRVLPAWLEAVPPSDRLAQAIGAVLNAWGSSDPLFDLNGDGTVDGLDIERAAEELPIP